MNFLAAHHLLEFIGTGAFGGVVASLVFAPRHDYGTESYNMGSDHLLVLPPTPEQYASATPQARGITPRGDDTMEGPGI